MIVPLKQSAKIKRHSLFSLKISHSVLVLLSKPLGFYSKCDNVALVLYKLALSAVIFRTPAVVDRFKILLLGGQKLVHATLFSTHCFEARLKRVRGVGA